MAISELPSTLSQNNPNSPYNCGEWRFQIDSFRTPVNNPTQEKIMIIQLLDSNGNPVTEERQVIPLTDSSGATLPTPVSFSGVIRDLLHTPKPSLGMNPLSSMQCPTSWGKFKIRYFERTFNLEDCTHMDGGASTTDDYIFLNAVVSSEDYGAGFYNYLSVDSFLMSDRPQINYVCNSSDIFLKVFSKFPYTLPVTRTTVNNIQGTINYNIYEGVTTIRLPISSSGRIDFILYGVDYSFIVADCCCNDGRLFWLEPKGGYGDLDFCCISEMALEFNSSEYCDAESCFSNSGSKTRISNSKGYRKMLIEAKLNSNERDSVRYLEGMILSTEKYIILQNRYGEDYLADVFIKPNTYTTYTRDTINVIRMELYLSEQQIAHTSN